MAIKNIIQAIVFMILLLFVIIISGCAKSSIHTVKEIVTIDNITYIEKQYLFDNVSCEDNLNLKSVKISVNKNIYNMDINSAKHIEYNINNVYNCLREYIKFKETVCTKNKNVIICR